MDKEAKTKLLKFKRELKKFWKAFWNLLWKDESWKGWVFSVIVIFILVRFVFFPFLSLVTGTSLPLAIVESCSMYHDDNFFSDFDEWWAENGDKYSEFDISKSEFDDFRLQKGFNKGDILFIVGTPPEKIDVGEVIIFQTSSKTPIIHRVVNIENKSGELSFSTIGDNNPAQIPFEENIESEQIIGKASVRIAPYVGWVKLAFFENQKSERNRGLCS